MNDHTQAKHGYEFDHTIEPMSGEFSERIHPSVEDEYWSIVHADQAFARPDLRFEDYLPAYRTGYMGAARYTPEGRAFEDVESLLEAEYARTKGDSALVWDQAKLPARAAWDRMAAKTKVVLR
ncbi:hypothetical protein [Arenimonas oryziterrae]|uniref:Uncharacterized protein n=1 Tax=Arenimonas oryziterrae DSM 21050 = YC6267 TaxID=1121015 RepID=A0A091AYF2_9GAMM|nr:hypothetical protein [Arenimonas oryziterrae]KFN44426.1 hypothetical protein N789_00025 [Arenimonas oryziterrae DSM 21050 = YC6267]